MADPYIDPKETQLYGPFAREQMHDVCMGLVTELDATVKFAIGTQKKADAAMKTALDAQPEPVTLMAERDTLAEARDTLVRFGKYIESIKGRPLALSVFFGAEAPSVAARRRVVKLVALFKEVHERAVEHKAVIPGASSWVAELKEAYDDVQAIERAQRASKVRVADLRPDVARARDEWLSVYTANKALITGLLRHAGKLQLLPLVFDDLAETHRVGGVSDDPAPGPASPAEPPPTP